MGPKTTNATRVSTPCRAEITPARRVALTALLLFTAALPANAQVRPFKGHIDGQLTARPTADPTIYVGGAAASGHGTHIGGFTKVTTDVVDVATGWTAGEFTMTVASGDQVTGEYEGFVLIDPVSGTLSWTLDATVTGGTGRFAHATGDFIFIATGEFFISHDGSAVMTYSDTFDGTIDY